MGNGKVDLTDFADAAGLLERSRPPTDGSWLIRPRRRIHRAGISHLGKQQPCRRACWDLHTPRNEQSRMTDGGKKEKASSVKIGDDENCWDSVTLNLLVIEMRQNLIPGMSSSHIRFN